MFFNNIASKASDKYYVNHDIMAKQKADLRGGGNDLALNIVN